MIITNKIKDLQLSHGSMCFISIIACTIQNKQIYDNVATQALKISLAIDIITNLIAILFCLLCSIILLLKDNYIGDERKSLNKTMCLIAYTQSYVMVANLLLIGDVKYGLIFFLLYTLSMCLDIIMLRRLKDLQDDYRLFVNLFGNEII